jgi:hypothetical protein
MQLHGLTTEIFVDANLALRVTLLDTLRGPTEVTWFK